MDSPNSFVVWIFRMPVWLIQPLMTSIPGSTSRGMDSPVRAEVSRVEKPLRIVPSSGMRSPGFTTMVSPI